MNYTRQLCPATHVGPKRWPRPCANQGYTRAEEDEHHLLRSEGVSPSFSVGGIRVPSTIYNSHRLRFESCDRTTLLKATLRVLRQSRIHLLSMLLRTPIRKGCAHTTSSEHHR